MSTYGPDSISRGIAQQYCAEYFILHLLPVHPGLSLTVNCSKQPLKVFLVIMSSTAIYSLIFFVFYEKLGHKNDLEVNSGSLHKWSLMDDSSEYLWFITVLAQTIFWYPFGKEPITWARSFAYARKPAFSVLLLPFCTVHLMIYSGYSVSGTGNVFANICYLMLGKLWYIGKGSVPHICFCQGHGGAWKVLWKQCISGVADFSLDDIHGQCTR